MKRSPFFHLHTITIALVLAVLCSTRFGKIFTAQGQQMPPMPDFNEMFKNFDFEQFANELDEELKAIEAEEAAAREAKPIIPQRPAHQASPKPPISKESGATGNPATEATPSDSEIATDPDQLIINPPIVNRQRDGKTVALPHQKALEALESYVHDITTSLQKIDQAALSDNSQEFREHYLATCSDTVTELLVSLAMLSSKKAYRVAVLAPPKELEQKLRAYRKNIITVRKHLMKLAASLVATEQQEVTKEELMRKRLEELSRVSLHMTTQEPISKPGSQPAIVTREKDDDTTDDLADSDNQPIKPAPYDPSFDFDQLMSGGSTPGLHPPALPTFDRGQTDFDDPDFDDEELA